MRIVIFFLLCSMLTLINIVFPGEGAGWGLFFASYISLIINKKRFVERDVFFSLMLILSVHQAMAILNSYILTLPGASVDAVYFFEEAVNFSDYPNEFLWVIGDRLYIQLVGSLFLLFGNSLFLFSQLSVIAFLLSTFVIIKMAWLLKFENVFTKEILLLFGLLPTMLLLSSTPLRESWEFLFFLASIYFCLKMKMNKSVLNEMKLLCCLVLLGLMHHALAIISLAILLTGHWWYIRNKNVKIAAVLILLFAISIFLSIMKNQTAAFQSLVQGDFIEKIYHYRESLIALQARATYDVNFADKSFLGIFVGFSQMLFYYWFAPFPWQISNFEDFYGMLESFFRYLLIINALLECRKSGQDLKKFLCVQFFLISSLWALGTTNWGQAMRHNLMGYGIILLIGYPRLRQHLIRIKSIKLYRMNRGI